MLKSEDFQETTAIESISIFIKFLRRKYDHVTCFHENSMMQKIFWSF